MAALMCAKALASEVELIRDPLFRRGLLVYSPEPGKHVVESKLRWTDATEPPVWGLAQWHSRASIAGAPRQELAGGAVRWSNETKRITLAPQQHPQGVLTLEALGSREYVDGARKQGEPWPHLLVSQRFAIHPALPELNSLRLRITARLLHSRLHRTPDFTPRRHAAQFQMFITLQNLNRDSEGYGDYLWFGIPLYDSRRPLSPAFHNPDQAGKFIFTPAAEVYTPHSLHDGEWVTIDKDLQPLLVEALQTAWERGFLQDSKQMADYRLGGCNLGWEIPGTFDAAVQVREVRLTASTR